MASDSGIPGHLPHQLAHWWEHGEGAAKIGWGTPGSFMRCVRLAEEEAHMTPERAKGFCAERYHAATGKWPGQHEHHRRSSVSTPADYDPDGLDSSWDGDCSDLPDLTGLGVEHMQAAEKAMGMAPPGEPSQRAMPKLGTGARFKKLKSSLAAKGARDPGALAAYIGRRKFGKAKFAKLAAKARGSSSRSEDQGRAESLGTYTRAFPLEDITVRTTRDGRIVEAYLAVFNTRSKPIHDQDGDYTEELDPALLNRAISDAAPQGSRRNWKVGVFYNHAMTLYGTPSERFSVPVAVTQGLETDGRGVRATDKYHRSQLCDEIVEGLESGAIPGYSFQGNFRRSSPLIPRGGFRKNYRTGELPHVRRLESTLKEYGPTPFPVYDEAAVLGLRSDSLMAAMMKDPDMAMRMLAVFRDSAPDGDSLPPPGAPHEGDSPAEDSHPLVRSGRSVKEEMQAARSAFLQRYRS
jgi:phage head maturation protease